MAGAVEGDTFVGRKTQDLRGLLKLTYPMEHGVVTNWYDFRMDHKRKDLPWYLIMNREDMERVWNYLYSEELKVLSEEVDLYK